MSSHVTAFIHATVAYPNLVGQPSLILEKLNDAPILVNTIQACLDAPEITQIVVVTSDADDDKAIFSIVEESFDSPSKAILIHPIPAEKEYSYVPERKKMREVAYPYMWKPYYGMYSIPGYQELNVLFPSKIVLLVDPSLMATLTATLLSTAVSRINNQAVIYAFYNPCRKFYGLSSEAFAGMIERTKSKVHFEIVQKGMNPILDDVFNFEYQDHNQSYTDRSAMAFKNCFFSVLRKRDIETIHVLNALTLSNCQELFESVMHSLYPFNLEYLAIEMASKEGDTLSSVSINKAINDFAQTGSVLHFVGEEDPFCSENLSEYIATAKEAGLLSVWVETQGTCLTAEGLQRCVESGLDLLIINVDCYLSRTDDLMKITDQITSVRKTGLPPLCVLVFETETWLTNEQEKMIEFFKDRVDRILVRNKSTNDKNTVAKKGIDFAPLQRTVCQQILNSLHLKANGAFGLCSRDAKGYQSAEEIDPSLLYDEVHRTLLSEHVNGEYCQSFDECQFCKEWYIPNVRHSFRNVLLPFCNGSRLNVDDASFQIDSSDIAEHEKKIVSIITKLEDISALYGDMEQKTQRVKSRSVNAYRGILDVYNNTFVASLENIYAIKKAYNNFLIMIGKRYIAFDQIDDALRVWEMVLTSDPSNEYIHRWLDELLETCEKN